MESIVELLFSIVPILFFVLVTRMIRDRGRKTGQAASFLARRNMSLSKPSLRPEARRESGSVDPVRSRGSPYRETGGDGRAETASGRAGEHGRGDPHHPAIAAKAPEPGRTGVRDRREQGRTHPDGSPAGGFAFPGAVTKLPPLKQAWLFSEILGPPVSMRGNTDGG